MRLQAFRPIAGALAILLGVTTPTMAQLRARVHISGLSRPIAFVQDPSDPPIQYVAEQAGRILVVYSGVLQNTPFLDIRSLITSNGEQGLLGLAFPPNYGASGRFYVLYTRVQDGYIVVARYKRSSRFTADPQSNRELRWSPDPARDGQRFRDIVHPYGNHNAGCLQFGADGMLYIASGDGGGSNDPFNSGQNTSSLLGKMLRIDVTSVADDHVDGFVVPAGNAGLPRPEIWSIGWRNPWRFSFDMGPGGTGAMIVADVGQGSREEINYEPQGRSGRNYGWDNCEGLLCNWGTDQTGLSAPVFDYNRQMGASVTGGYVYRGSQIPSLHGRYFFADYVYSRVWSIALTLNGAGEATASDLRDHTSELATAGSVGGISSFGVDSRNELYLVDHRRGMIIALTRALLSPPTSMRIVR